jgi:hypothetical protein
LSIVYVNERISDCGIRIADFKKRNPQLELGTRPKGGGPKDKSTFPNFLIPHLTSHIHNLSSVPSV